MSALEPGLYRATVEGVPNIDIAITDEGGRGQTLRRVSDSCQGTYGHAPEDITDARRLLVLDLVPVQVDYLRHALNRWIEWSSLTDEKRTLDGLLGQIEAQTKPARIEEPGLWGVVEAERQRYVRYSTGSDDAWSDLLGRTVAWADLPDPTLVREGI